MHVCKKSGHKPWHSSQSRLVQETRCVVVVEEGRGVEHATRQIPRVDASEAVGGSCVYSDPKNTGICSIVDLKVCNYFRGVVLRGRRTTVPVEGNTFLTGALRLLRRKVSAGSVPRSQSSKSSEI